MVDDEEDGDDAGEGGEEDEEEEDDDEPRKKKKPKKEKKPKRTKKRAKDEDDEDDDEERDNDGGDGEDNEESLEESDEASEKEELISVQQQLKSFHKIAALGQLFLKYTGRRRRKPQDRIVKVSFGEGGNPKQISWGSGSRHIDFEDVVYIAWGHWTPVFQARKDQIDANLCFSVVGKTQILDVQAQSKEMAELWVKGLRKLIGQTDEQALLLSKQGLEHETFGGAAQPKKEEKATNKEQKKRARSLMLLQQDLFVMTTTTVFRNLEEERIWDIDQSVRDRFNAKLLYEEALKEDVPWRQWNQWIRERVVVYLKENNRVTMQQPIYVDQITHQMNYPQQITQPINQPINQPMYRPVQTVPIQQQIQPMYQQPVQTQTYVQQTTGMVQGMAQPTNVQAGQQDEACTLM